VLTACSSAPQQVHSVPHVAHAQLRNATSAVEMEAALEKLGQALFVEDVGD